MENQRLRELAGLVTEKLWSGEVKTKWTPPAGLFTGTPKQIVAGLLKAPGGRSKAMSRLNFYINRAGKKLSAEDKARLEKAKDMLRINNESYLQEVEAYARRAGLILEKKKDTEDEDPDMDLGDEDGGADKDKEEDKEELPKIVKSIAKKAVGKDEEALEDLIMKVYTAGHKDGMKDKEDEMKKDKSKDDVAEGSELIDLPPLVAEDWAEIQNAMARVSTKRVGKPCMTPKGSGTIEVETATLQGGLTDPKAGPYNHVVTVKLNNGSKQTFPWNDIKLFKGKTPSGAAPYNTNVGKTAEGPFPLNRSGSDPTNSLPNFKGKTPSGAAPYTDGVKAVPSGPIGPYYAK
jgi:hypothetical protein